MHNRYSMRASLLRNSLVSRGQILKSTVRRTCAPVLATMAILLLGPATGSAQADTEILTNESIIQMVTGKLSKELISGKINSAVPGFDLSSEGLIKLSTSKVDQKTIKEMIDVGDGARRRGTGAPSLSGLDEILSNEIVVRMVAAKVPKPIILAKMQISRSAYDVSAAGLVTLNTSKVPEDVIKAMMLPPVQAAAPAKAIPVRDAPSAPPAKVTPPAGKKPPPKKVDTTFMRSGAGRNVSTT